MPNTDLLKIININKLRGGRIFHYTMLGRFDNSNFEQSVSKFYWFFLRSKVHRSNRRAEKTSTFPEIEPGTFGV